MGKKGTPHRRFSKEEKMKYEVAEELGLLDKVLKEGWRSLTSKETGKIGGLVTKKRRDMRVEKQNIICYNQETEENQVRL